MTYSKDGSMRGLVSNTRSTKTPARTSADVQFDNGGDKKQLGLQINPSVGPVLRSEVSSTPHPDPSVKALESLLSDLQFDKNKPKSPSMFPFSLFSTRRINMLGNLQAL